MFGIFKKKRSRTELVAVDEEKDKDDSVAIATGFVATESARVSTQIAAKKFAKPDRYDRSILDDGTAKKNIKLKLFNSGVEVRDPYTGDILALTKAEAKMKYGDDWTNHLAEADHKISLKKDMSKRKIIRGLLMMILRNLRIVQTIWKSYQENTIMQKEVAQIKIS